MKNPPRRSLGMRRLVAACLMFAALAGCVGEDAPAADVPAIDSQAEPGRAEVSTGDARAAAVVPAADANATVPVFESVPFAFDGELGRVACVPSGPASCTGLRQGSERFGIIETGGRPVRAILTLTWESSAPTTEELWFGIARMRSCGDGCFEGDNAIEPVRGASPQLLAGELPVLEPDESFFVWAYEGAFTPDPVYAQLHAEQAFRVEGMLTIER